MSVLVTMKVHGDTEQFRRFIAGEEELLREIAADAQAGGCVHHRFGVGDGFVLVVDEWESAEAFKRFFEGHPKLPEVMQKAGTQGEPSFEFTEAVTSADQF
jgi:hypothetical protein